MTNYISYKNVEEAFVDLAKLVYKNPEYTTNPRNLNTKEAIGIAIKVENPYDRIVMNEHRNLSLKYALGEWLWYLRGSNKLSEITYYSEFWKKISDDGKTANSAYGCRIFGTISSFSNQWNNIKKELIKDNNSRRAVLQIFSNKDLKPNTKDVPCTISLQFLIRENKLHLFCNMRSNDLVLGFPYDVFTFTLFQELMLVELSKDIANISMGYYFHNITSLHIYERDFSMIENVINNDKKNTAKNLMPKIKSLEQLNILQENERIIREGFKETVKKITDDFCIYCQNILIK